jgi:hypothetical protein
LKTERRIPIIKEELEPYFILGVFDADGCITWGKRKDRDRLWQKVTFTSSLSILEGVQKVLLKQTISTILRPKSNEDCYIIEFCNEHDVYKFYKWLPKDSFSLVRKHENYVQWLAATISKYTLKITDRVTFTSETTMRKYNLPKMYIKGTFEIINTNGKQVQLNNGNWYPSIILTKEGISNYALRLELEEIGETTINSTIPSRADGKLSEGVETTGVINLLNNQHEHPSIL